MKYSFLPKTRNGTWSVCLFIAFILFAVVSSLVSLSTGNTIEYPSPMNSPVLGTLIYLTFSAAVFSSLIGLISLIKNKERAFSVFLVVPPGIVFLIVILVFLFANLIGTPG